MAGISALQFVKLWHILMHNIAELMELKVPIAQS